MSCNGWDLGPGVSEALLAKEYGISPSRVQEIRRRAEWAIREVFNGETLLRLAVGRADGKSNKWIDPETGLSAKNIRRLGSIFRIFDSSVDPSVLPGPRP